MTEQTSPPTSTFAGRVVAPAACAFVIALGVGGALGLLEARRVLDAHRYLELDFTRNAYFAARNSAWNGLEVALPWALAVLAGAAVVAAVYRRTRGALPLTYALGDRIAAWIAAAMFALLGSAALIHLERFRGWIGARDAGFVVVVSLAVAFVVRALSRAARKTSDQRTHANIAGIAAAFAFAAPLGFWLGRELPYRVHDTTRWKRELVVLAIALVLGAWVRARALARARGRSPRWITGPIGVATVAGAVLTLAPCVLRLCEGALAKPQLVARNPQNVVLIAIDTLRADQLALDGLNPRGRDTTPNLRRLAQRGVYFEKAISQAPWTLPAFTSILTGAYPNEHGAFSMVGHLREREVTLAEVFREAGHETAGVVSQVYLQRGEGFEQGCEHYDDSPIASEQEANGDRVTDGALEWLARRDGRPFFLFTHYFDPHNDYVAHDDWPWADDYDGWLTEQMAFDNLERNRQSLDAADWDYVHALYDEETAFTDREIGRLLEDIERRGLSESTWIVVTVDHGEQFMEHGGVGHCTTLYDELINVPLIVVPPRGTPAVRADVVETRNVFGTLCEALGFERAAGGAPVFAEQRARDLLKVAADPRAFSIVWLPDARPSAGKRLCASALVAGGWKAIHDWTRDRRALYDLARDPLEHDNALAREPEIAARMFEELDAWTLAQVKLGGSAATRALDHATLDALQKLGYIGDGH